MTDTVRRAVSERKRRVLRGIFASGLITITMLCSPLLGGTAAADSLVLGGSNWFYGNGVDVRSGGDGSQMTQSTPMGGTVTTGSKWQCVELVNRLYAKMGWITTRWTGNGNQMYDTAPNTFTKETNNNITSVTPGDVVVYNDGGNGHVAIVNSTAVNANGTTTVTTVNQNTNSVYMTSTLTGKTLSSPLNGYSVTGVVHAPSNRIGALSSNGTLTVKEGAIDAGWVTELGNVTDFALTGRRIAALTSDGTLYVKDGDLGAQWVAEKGNVSSFAISANRIAVVTTDGTLYAKQGDLYAGWVTELGSVSSAVVSANRLGALTTDGVLHVKEGDLYQAWVTELGGVSAAALSGNRIAALSGGVLYVKDGTLGAPWVAELGNVTSMSLAGSRIGATTSDGVFRVKDGDLYAGWVAQMGGTAGTVASNRISIIGSDGVLYVKQGDVYQGWVAELGNVTRSALN